MNWPDKLVAALACAGGLALFLWVMSRAMATMALRWWLLVMFLPLVPIGIADWRIFLGLLGVVALGLFALMIAVWRHEIHQKNFPVFEGVPVRSFVDATHGLAFDVYVAKVSQGYIIGIRYEVESDDNRCQQFTRWTDVFPQSAQAEHAALQRLTQLAAGPLHEVTGVEAPPPLSKQRRRRR